MRALQQQQEKLQQERQRAEEALQESEEQFRDLYESVPIAYISIGSDGLIQRANQRTVELFGDLIERSVPDLCADTPMGKEKVHRLVRLFSAGEEIHGEEVEMRRADGRSVWISLSARPVQDEAGQVVSSRLMAVDISARKRAEQSLADEVRAKYNHEEITGKSAGLQEIIKQVELAPPTDTSVLILGETGTGKELICRAIHHLNLRSTEPLVKLNCAAIPSGLIESELFGHEKGAFTGAISQKQGCFELAHGGTIFLDEIGDIPLETQPKLLRLLQEQEFERVGSTRTIKVDVRVIAATHRNLEEMVQEGRFREDLFYRLNVFPILLPPLRERREDIPSLTCLFVDRICARWGRPPCAISKAGMQRLLSYPWPGNVRELENIVERAVILCGGQTIEDEHIQVEPGASPAAGGPIRPLQEIEREHIVAALQAAGGKVSGKGGAAELLGLKPTTLDSRMKKLRIDPNPS